MLCLTDAVPVAVCSLFVRSVFPDGCAAAPDISASWGGSEPARPPSFQPCGDVRDAAFRFVRLTSPEIVEAGSRTSTLRMACGSSRFRWKTYPADMLRALKKGVPCRAFLRPRAAGRLCFNSCPESVLIFLVNDKYCQARFSTGIRSLNVTFIEAATRPPRKAYSLLRRRAVPAADVASAAP